MANTYTLIASNTLSSSAASVTFSAIPGTYTDLVLRISARNNDTGNATGNIQMTLNGTPSGTAHSFTYLAGTGAAVSSARGSSSSFINIFRGIDGPSATASTFSSVEIYIPSYLVSQNKPIGAFAVNENNSTTAYMSTVAGLWSSTSAITSIHLESSSGSFVSGSSFFLYGIKNS